MVERGAYPERVGALVAQMELETDSITEQLEDKGIVFADAEHVIDAVAASAEDARLLGVRPRAPMLRERRHTTDLSGTPVEWSDDRYLGSAVAFSVHNSVAVNALSRTAARTAFWPGLVWSMPPRSRWHRLRPARKAAAVYLSPDDQYLAVNTNTGATRDGQLSVFRLENERLGDQLGSWNAGFERVAWSASGGAIAFINPARHAEIVRLPGSTSAALPGIANAVDFFPDGTRLAVLGETALKIYDADSLSLIREAELPEGNFTAFADYRNDLAISPNGQWLACTSLHCTVQILEAAALRVVHELAAHKNMITDLEWLGPDLLATASVDCTIRIWQVSAERERRLLEVDDDVFGITYSPDPRRIDRLDGEHLLGLGPRHRQDPLAGKDAGTRQLERPLRRRVTAQHAAGHPERPAAHRDPGLAQPGRRDRPRLGQHLRQRQDPPARRLQRRQVRPRPRPGGPAVRAHQLHARQAHLPDARPRAHRRRRTAAAGGGALPQREVLIRDLARQPGYRIVHQLHLGDATVALVVFDATSDTTPLAGVGYRARALQHAQATRPRRDTLATFLVAARIDRGVVNVSDERLTEVVAEFGFRDYLRTSAKEGWGVPELRAALLRAIDWAAMPVVTSNALFAAAKSFVLDEKEQAPGILLTPMVTLQASFVTAPVTGPAAEAAPAARVGRDLLDSEPDGEEDEQARLRRVFACCVARLEYANLVKHLAFGDLVLLQPELIDVYAGAIVNAARLEPDGLGSMLESRVLDVRFPIPAQERIKDSRQERLLIIATIEELTRHEIVLREETEQGVQLVFPAAFRKDLPDADEPPDVTVEFSFEGPVGNIYATLVVRLARSDRFILGTAWQSAAQFGSDGGGRCTVQLVGSDEGRGTLQLGYDTSVPDVIRRQFERFVLNHLERRATPGTVRRLRLYKCPECGTALSPGQIQAALSLGNDRMFCPVCGKRIPLDDPAKDRGHDQDAVAREMDASADAARRLAANSSVIRGKEETTDYDVFLCHNEEDKDIVRWAYDRLRERGILPWLDAVELQPGRDWQDELERQIEHIRSAAVFVGPSGIGPWQKQEIRGFLNEFANRDCPVIPVLLPGGEPPARTATRPALPVFLRTKTWVDLSSQDDAGIDRLIWGITGRKPVQPGPEPSADRQPGQHRREP